jgi:NAD+ kinase
LVRLGFLASVNKNDIAAAIYAVVNKQFTLDSRELLNIESGGNIFGTDNFALNDITIHKRDDSAMITTHAYLKRRDPELVLGRWDYYIYLNRFNGLLVKLRWANYLPAIKQYS